MNIIKMLKKVDLYVLIGLSYILFVIWNRLRIKLPREVPFEVHPEILSLLCKTLPIILTILLLVEIKQKYFTKRTSWSTINRMVNRIKEHKVILYYNEILESICKRLVLLVSEIKFENKSWLIEKMFYLFNFLIFGTKQLFLDKKYNLDEISVSKRFITVDKLSQVATIFPVLVVSCVAIIEIFVTGIFKYTYILCPILLISVIWKAYLYVITEYCILRLKAEEYPGFQINVYLEEKNEEGMTFIEISKKSKHDIELIPIEKTTEIFTESEIKQIEVKCKYYFYICNISAHLQEENKKMFRKLYTIILILRILILSGIFYR